MNIFEQKYLGKVVHCDTEEKAEALIELANENGFNTKGCNKWNIHKENFCLRLSGGSTTYSDFEFYDDLEYEIVKFEFEPEIPQEEQLKNAMVVIMEHCKYIEDGCPQCIFNNDGDCYWQIGNAIPNDWDLSILDKPIEPVKNLFNQEIEYVTEAGQMHALVKGCEERDDRLVWVSLIPLRVEDNEPVYAVEYVHEEKFEERKASELEEWYWA